MAEVWDDAADTGISKANMADGVYEVKVKKWAGKPFEKGDQKGRIVKLTMEIVGVGDGIDADKYVGQELKEDWWLTRRVAKDIFFNQELKSIGYDVDSWPDDAVSPTRKAAMLPLALKHMKMRGLTLHLKRFKTGDYANLRFVGRVADTDPPQTIPNDDVLAVAEEIENEDELF